MASHFEPRIIQLYHFLLMIAHAHTCANKKNTYTKYFVSFFFVIPSLPFGQEPWGVA